MTDRELLERAARAAGLDVEWTAGEPFLGEKIWNPLEDDADAFRLMVAMDMVVAVSKEGVLATLDEEIEFIEPIVTDALSATRRAIVRAAAAMAE